MDGIEFREADHSYWRNGNEYLSVSTLLGFLKKPFDPDGKILRRCAKRDGKTPEELQKEWHFERDYANSLGTAFHNSAEHYILTGEILDDDFRDYMEQFIKIKPEGFGYEAEKLLWHDGLRLAGTADLITWTGKYTFLLGDYKTNKTLSKFSRFGEKFLCPIDYLYECNFTTYSLQLNLYKYLLEQMGYLCEGMMIYYINRSKHKVEEHSISIMDREIELILDHYSQFRDHYIDMKRQKHEDVEL
jgi:hypothetical protein